MSSDIEAAGGGLRKRRSSVSFRKLRELKILEHRSDRKMAYHAVANRSVADLATRALRKEVA